MRNWQLPGGTWSSLGLSGEKVWLSPTPKLEDDLRGGGGGRSKYKLVPISEIWQKSALGYAQEFGTRSEVAERCQGLHPFPVRFL